MATPSDDHSYSSDDERFADYEVEDWDEEAYQREYEATYPSAPGGVPMDNNARIIPSAEASSSQPSDAHYYQTSGPNDDNSTGRPDYGLDRRSGSVQTWPGTERIDHASREWKDPVPSIALRTKSEPSGFVPPIPNSEHADRDRHYVQNLQPQNNHQSTSSGSREPQRPTFRRVPVPKDSSHIGGDSEGKLEYN